MTSTVTLSGPLFAGGVSEKVQQAAEDVVRELTELGMQRLTSPRPDGVPVVSGNLRRNIAPRIDGLNALIDGNQPVYAAWIEGVSSRNESSRYKGVATFRRASQWLNDQAETVAQKHAEKLAKELGG